MKVNAHDSSAIENSSGDNTLEEVTDIDGHVPKVVDKVDITCEESVDGKRDVQTTNEHELEHLPIAIADATAVGLMDKITKCDICSQVLFDDTPVMFTRCNYLCHKRCLDQLKMLVYHHQFPTQSLLLCLFIY